MDAKKTDRDECWCCGKEVGELDYVEITYRGLEVYNRVCLNCAIVTLKLQCMNSDNLDATDGAFGWRAEVSEEAIKLAESW